MKRTFSTIILLALAVCSAGAEVLAPETLDGRIIDPARPLGLMQVGQEEIVLHLGPIWFWELNEFKLAADEELQVVGEIVDVEGVKHLYPERLILEDREIELANEDGIPHWARGGPHGRGRDGRGHRGGGRHGRNGRGNCWRN